MKVINTSRKVFIKRATCQRQPCELEIQRKMNIYIDREVLANQKIHKKMRDKHNVVSFAIHQKWKSKHWNFFIE